MITEVCGTAQGAGNLKSLSNHNSNIFDGAPKVGLAAFEVFLSILTPVRGSQRLYLKAGQNKTLIMDEFRANAPIWETEGTLEEIRRATMHSDAWDYIEKISSTTEGGMFFLPGQPQGKHIQNYILDTYLIPSESDKLPHDEQRQRIKEFTDYSGLMPAFLIGSGGKSIHHYLQSSEPLTPDQNKELRRWQCVALLSDPAVANSVNQAMRLPCGTRVKGGKRTEQSLVYANPVRYSFDEIKAGLGRYFTAKGWRVPPSMPKDWFQKELVPILDADDLPVEVRDKLIEGVLAIGVDGWEELKKIESVARKAEQQIKMARRPVEVADGMGRSLIECVSDAEKYAGEVVLSLAGHSDKKRGRCPFHKSHSGTSAWRGEFKDGSIAWHCKKCTSNEAIGIFQLWLSLQAGTIVQTPKGSDYVKAAKAFCDYAGISLPDWKPAPKKQIDRKPKGYASIKKDGENYTGDRIEKILSIDAKHILDQTDTGGGKTTDIINNLPRAVRQIKSNARVIVTMPDAFNPPIKMPENYTRLTPRLAYGLRKDKDNKIRRADKATPDNERIKSGGFCPYTDAINNLWNMGFVHQEKGLNPVCNTCTLKNACQSTPGWYYYDNRKAKESEKDLYCNLQSLIGADLSDRPTWVAVDEATAALITKRDISATVSDIKKDLSDYIASIEHGGANAPYQLLGELPDIPDDYQTILRRVESRLDKANLSDLSNKGYGLNPIELMAFFADINPDDIKKILAILNCYYPTISVLSKNHPQSRAEMDEKVQHIKESMEARPNAVLLPLLEALSGDKTVSLSLYKGKLTATINDRDRYSEMLSTAQQIIWLDATADKEELEQRLGIPGMITAIHKGDGKPWANVNVKVIEMKGIASLKNISENAKNRVATIVEEEKQKNIGRTLVIAPKSDRTAHGGYLNAQLHWGGGSRASNDYQGWENAILVRPVCPNIGEKQRERLAVFGTMDGFEEWIQRLINEEIIQGGGRLRANRYPKKTFNITIITKPGCDYDYLRQIGATVELVNAPSSSLHKYQQAANALLADNQPLTYQSIAEKAGTTRRALEKSLAANDLSLDNLGGSTPYSCTTNLFFNNLSIEKVRNTGNDTKPDDSPTVELPQSLDAPRFEPEVVAPQNKSIELPNIGIEKVRSTGTNTYGNTRIGTVDDTQNNTEAEPMEWSDYVARNDEQIRRLGWTALEAMAIRKARYGKRHRENLADADLWDWFDFCQGWIAHGGALDAELGRLGRLYSRSEFVASNQFARRARVAFEFSLSVEENLRRLSVPEVRALLHWNGLAA